MLNSYEFDEYYNLLKIIEMVGPKWKPKLSKLSRLSRFELNGDCKKKRRREEGFEKRREKKRTREVYSIKNERQKTEKETSSLIEMILK